MNAAWSKHGHAALILTVGLCSAAFLGNPSSPASAQEPADARISATRAVVEAVVDAARRNAAERRLRGDELTSYLVQAAAAAAGQQPQAQRAVAFLAGIAIAIDTSNLMREQPFTGQFVRAVESDDERKARLTVLGSPTLRQRHDLAQHFFVSAQLTALVGAPLAETAGVAKEMHDAQTSSGFSFTDLCADLAGVALAQRVLKQELTLKQLAASFKVSDYLPDLIGLRDGLSHAEFVRDFGSPSDPRFQAVVADIRARVAKLPK